MSLARRMLLTTAESTGMDPEIGYDMSLALTEACANVIEHAGGASGYRVTAGISEDRCWIDVIDDGDGFEPRRLARHIAAASLAAASQDTQAEPVLRRQVDRLIATPENGRGLMLIAALADRVCVRNHPNSGAFIHFERDLRPRTTALAAYGHSAKQ